MYYKLNVNSLGEAVASSDPKYQNGLDGSNIIAQSITADHIAVTDLVAFGATIGGFHINNHSLYSGVKTSISNTTEGIFLGDDGQVNIGDATNFVKFFKDANGEFKLEIAADSISFGTEKTTVESLYQSVKSNSEDLTNYITTTNRELEDLQGQIDGSIMTHFKEYAPLPFIDNKTSRNEPAKTWMETDTTNGNNNLKNNHLGDLFYDTITGYCYRWQVQNNEYFWNRITDVDVTKALADAAKAQDPADCKRRVFVDTPVPPYDIGDLWTQGLTGDIMRCQVAKTKDQSYSATDWVKASKEVYSKTETDAAINVTKESIELNASKTYETITNVTNKVSTAKSEAISTAANDATSKANAAKSEAISTAAEDATNKVNNIAIGGRNYVLDTTDEKYLQSFGFGNPKRQRAFYVLLR